MRRGIPLLNLGYPLLCPKSSNLGWYAGTIFFPDGEAHSLKWGTSNSGGPYANEQYWYG